MSIVISICCYCSCVVNLNCIVCQKRLIVMAPVSYVLGPSRCFWCIFYGADPPDKSLLRVLRHRSKHLHGVSAHKEFFSDLRDATGIASIRDLPGQILGNRFKRGDEHRRSGGYYTYKGRDVDQKVSVKKGGFAKPDLRYSAFDIRFSIERLEWPESWHAVQQWVPAVPYPSLDFRGPRAWLNRFFTPKHMYHGAVHGKRTQVRKLARVYIAPRPQEYVHDSRFALKPPEPKVKPNFLTGKPVEATK